MFCNALSVAQKSNNNLASKISTTYDFAHEARSYNSLNAMDNEFLN